MVYNSLNSKDPNNQILKKYFSTQNEWKSLDRLYGTRFNTKDSLIEFELDLLENEIQKILLKNDFSKEENDIINNIRLYFSNNLFYNSNFFHYLSNPIFNEKNCLNKLFDEQQIKIIFEKQNNLKKEINNYLQKYLNDEYLSENEQINMFTFLSSEYSNSPEYNQQKKEIIKKMMKKDKQNNYYEVNFSYNYFHQLQSYNNDYEPCKLYFDYRYPYIDSNGNIISCEFPSRASNAGAYIEGMIVINSFPFSRDNKNDVNIYLPQLISSISTVLHESWHAKQFDDFNNQKYTGENLDHIISRMLFSDVRFYKTNYDFATHELHARSKQDEETIRMISKFSDDKALIEQQTKYVKKRRYENNVINSYAMVIPDINSDTSSPQILDEYIVEELEKKLKQNRQLLFNNKLLQLFYNSYGCLKSFEEIVNKYYEIITTHKDFDYNCDCDKLFYPFLTNSIKRYNLDKSRENNPFNARVQTILKKLLNIEVNELLTMITGYEYYRTFEQTHLRLLNKNFVNSQNVMIKERLKRFKSYIPYIKNSKEVEKIIEPLEPYLGEIEPLNNHKRT